MEKNISSKKQMREENISTSQSSFQDLVNRFNSKLKLLKEDLVAASLVHCDDEKEVYDLSKKILDKYIKSIITISDENSIVTEKSICINCTDYIDLHRYELEWKEISSHNQIDFLDFIAETNMAQKLLYDVDGFFNKVICHINNSLHSGYFFYLKTVSVNPELDDSSCKMRASAVITLDINNQTESTSKR